MKHLICVLSEDDEFEVLLSYSRCQDVFEHCCMWARYQASEEFHQITNTDVQLLQSLSLLQGMLGEGQRL